MATILQNLHQSLYQLKTSRLMENKLFSELYNEAKVHEKNANLNKLVSGTNNDRLVKETNFYLILARMLNEIRDCDSNDSESKRNLEKIYKWYIKNKTQFSKSRSQPKKIVPNKQPVNMYKDESSPSEPSIDKQTPIDIETSEIPLVKKTILSERNLSPIYFPLLRNDLTTATTASKHSSTQRKKSVDHSRALNSASTKKTPLYRPVSSVSKDKSSTLSGHTALDATNSGKEKLDEKSRTEILKALSSYANHLYSNLDDKDGTKLKSNLKSLTKFYDTLNEKKSSAGTGLRRTTSGKSPAITLQSVIDLAKDVSDKMVLSKAKMNAHVNENKLFLESLKSTKTSEINDADTKLEDLLDKNSLNSQNFLGYSITIKDNTSRRPKSTSFIDWRGQYSRPSTANNENRKAKSMTKFPSTSLCSTPRAKQQRDDHLHINQTETEMPLGHESSSGMSSRRKSKRIRSAMFGSQQQLSHSSESIQRAKSSTEPKEVKFVNFVQKIDDTQESAAALSKDTQSHTTKESSEIKPATPAPSLEKKSTSAMSVTTVATPSLPQNEIKVVITRPPPMPLLRSCTTDDAILCECCKYPLTPSTTFVKQSTNTLAQYYPINEFDDKNIFHLTSTMVDSYQTDQNLQHTGDDVKINEQTENNGNEPNHEYENEDSVKFDLKNVLISNYDPKFANKIGVKDFVPVQLMSSHLNERSERLEFIPFEQIDQSYPKNRGFPTFNPNHNKTQPKLYRTNPSIPRPESKYGSRSSVYEQIISLKRQNIDSKALVVWQPEDVHLVRDLLKMEHKPLTEVLRVDQLKADVDYEEMGIEKPAAQSRPTHTNKHITPMGRPVNTNVHTRWKAPYVDPNKSNMVDLVEIDSDWTKIGPNENLENFLSESNVQHEISDIVAHQKNPEFKIFGIGANKAKAKVEPGRPMPTAQSYQDTVKEQEAFNKYTEAKKLVHIPSIFRGTTVRNHVKEYSLEDRLKREETRLAAIKIQRNYRKHLRDKRFIENRPAMRPELIEWARDFKSEVKRRKSEKEQSLASEQSKIEEENRKLKDLISRIGIHVDLYKILHKKGAEYTNRVLDSAATCIQRWVRGWLIRKDLNRLKEIITNDGTKWMDFTKRYRKTIIRIQKMRGMNRIDFEFKSSEALEFYQKEKKYTSYFKKLAFLNEIELNDVEKLFNYLEYYPTREEIQEAKTNVLKYYKRKANSTSIEMKAMFDIIYYIYPPKATKLKSTRKSTWMNPIVDGEDALRLKGFKMVETTSFERTWKLLTENVTNERSKISKNTPEFRNYNDD